MKGQLRRPQDNSRAVADPEVVADSILLKLLLDWAVIRLRSGSPPELDNFPPIAF